MTRRLGDWCRNRNKLPDLARSLNNLSIRLGDIGQSKKDLAAKEVFTIRRKFDKNPDLWHARPNQSNLWPS